MENTKHSAGEKAKKAEISAELGTFSSTHPPIMEEIDQMYVNTGIVHIELQFNEEREYMIRTWKPPEVAAWHHGRLVV